MLVQICDILNVSEDDLWERNDFIFTILKLNSPFLKAVNSFFFAERHDGS